MPLAEIPRQVVAYAYLSQSGAQGSDLLQRLSILFRPIAHERAGQPFDPKECSEALSQFYGLKVHPWAIQGMAPRLETAGILEKQFAKGDVAAYSFARIEAAPVSLEASAITTILDEFIRFTSPVVKLHRLNWSEERLKSYFLEHLTQPDFIGAVARPAKTAESQPSAGTLALKKRAESNKGRDPVRAHDAKLDVLCASFVAETSRSNPSLFNKIVHLTSSAMLAEVVLDVQSPETNVSLNELTIVLDAPFLMGLLDLNTPASRDYAKALADELKSHGAKLGYFRHSAKEIRSTIDATYSAFERGEGEGPLANRMRNRLFIEYVLTVKDAIELRLETLGVSLIADPTANEYRFFTGEEEETLREMIGDYWSRAALERDARSIAYVMRLRRNKRAAYSSLHKAQFVLLTENARLAERSTMHLVRTKLLAEGEVAPCLTAHYLAGVLWMMYGGKSLELSRFELLSRCSAATELHNDIVSRSFQFLKDLDEVKAQHFMALMTTERAGQFLMKQTLGDPMLVTSDNVEEILDRISVAAADKVARQKDEELQRERRQHERELERLTKELEIKESQARKSVEDLTKATAAQQQEWLLRQKAASDELVQAKFELEHTRKQLEALSVHIADRENKAESNEYARVVKCVHAAYRTGEMCEYAVFVVITLVAASLGVLAAFIGDWMPKESSARWIIVSACALAAGSLGIFGFRRAGDRILNPLIAWSCSHALRRRAERYEITHVLPDYAIDLRTKEVRKKAAQ